MKKNKAIKKSFIISCIICILYLIICTSLTIKYNFEFIFIIFLINYLYSKLYSFDDITISYQQIEVLIPLLNDLNIIKKLPNTRGYAASPDYLYKITDTIKKNNPNLILEAGSGVSTLIAAYTIKKYGRGKIISLDHNEIYAKKTRQELKKHNLEKYADVIYAPLKENNLDDNKNLRWYDTDKFNINKKIDLFIIDGPPKNTKKSKFPRYPALPLMLDKIQIGSTIILDDARRKNEQETIKLWKKEYSFFEFDYIDDNDKGIAIIKRIK